MYLGTAFEPLASRHLAAGCAPGHVIQDEHSRLPNRDSAMTRRIPVVVIEDNRLVRDGITAMLAEGPEFKVVAAVDRADSALRRG